MVGVPGKYKGCETCRRRRVKCTNERPFCQKCTNSGRECEGYEREMVFITGTIEAKGRVASHPRKGTPSSRQGTPSSRQGTPASSVQKQPSPKAESKQVQGQVPTLVPLHPLTSAWDDYITVMKNGVEGHALMTALQVPLRHLLREEEDGTGFKIALPPYTPLELPKTTGRDDSSAQCLVSDNGEGSSEGYCVFLFEQKLGAPPQNLADFPNHHFFVRVYRPLTISVALLSRRATFLSDTEWKTVPWEKHPKSSFDELLDIIASLPALFERTDRLLPLQATLARRHEAQQLLYSCLTLETQFDQWLAGIDGGAPEQPLTYWAEESTSPSGAIPFPESYSFKDGMTGLMFMYYWMSQILLHGCIDTLHGLIFEAVMDAYPDMWPDLPPLLQIDPARYQKTSELAANICRGLDSTLEMMVQPDMLIAPMTVVINLYRDMSHDGILEILWLEAFRGRLAEKGQHVATVLQGNRWSEFARF